MADLDDMAIDAMESILGEDPSVIERIRSSIFMEKEGEDSDQIGSISIAACQASPSIKEQDQSNTITNRVKELFHFDIKLEQ